MANLKELKTRISSVKSTQKITSAMKMVAASRLKKAQEAAESARPYAEKMNSIVSSLITARSSLDGAPPLLAGTGSEENYLLVVMTSDRGLCGGYNSNIVRETRLRARELKDSGKVVKLLCIGRKGRDQLKGEFGDEIVHTYEDVGRGGIEFAEAENITNRVLELFDAGEFDVCMIIYNKFVSAITQVVTRQKIIPVEMVDNAGVDDDIADDVTNHDFVYEFEPSEEGILEVLLPDNIKVQIFGAMLESSASEHGSRMSAMDNATRNAGEMIDGLTLTFNRTRQAKITSELIEIISGAEAL